MHSSSRIVLVAVVAACASAPQRVSPRLAGVVPLQITVRGSLYAGTATLGDGHSGTFTVTGPVEVKGSVQARTVRDSVTLELVYAIAVNNCRGTMNLKGTFTTPGTHNASGTVNATDSCVGAMSGTFRIGQ